MTLTDTDGNEIKTFNGGNISLNPGEIKTAKASAEVDNLHFWSWGYGYLYTVKTTLTDSRNRVFDEVSTRTDFVKPISEKEKSG